MNALEAYLKTHKIKPKDFAVAIGVSRNTAYRLRKGKRKPRKQELIDRIYAFTGGVVTHGWYNVTPLPTSVNQN